jgi:trehalose 6-phosphate phosphatase
MKRVNNTGRSARIPVPGADWAYFFDIDGTLVDIAESPAGAIVDRSLANLIKGLHRSAGGALSLISGRTIADIDRLFPGVCLPLAGQHGVDRRDGSGRIVRETAAPAQLDLLRERIAQAVAPHSGLLLEDKGLSLALHYRRVPRLGSFVHRLLRSLQAEMGVEYCLQPGKRVVEVKPCGSNKGAAIEEFMGEPPFKGRVPVFIGDDVTDEQGFATVNRLGGHSVKVGPGRTVARWRLPNVAAVRQWLQQSVQTANGEPEATKEPNS